ncbi:MAG: hypothetical protein GEU88_14075 [Solirubrobacterales bacterium]|nr:hypothetical protein [Solirubrobacterales bacterium]
MPDSKLRLGKPKLSEHPVDIGLRTEAAILSELVRRGYSLLLPFGVNQRYDLVFDLGGEFMRAQCKTGRLRRGSVVFRTASVQSNTRGSRCHGYRGDADVFLVYCPETDVVYVVPVAESPKGHMMLRVDRTANGQSERIRWASDYELPA